MQATLVERPRDEQLLEMEDQPVDVVQDSIFPQIMRPELYEQQAILFDQQQEEDVSIKLKDNYFWVVVRERESI